MKPRGVHIEFIPKAQQRYETCGDWWLDDDGMLQIRVSNDEAAIPTDSERFLTALHELVEAYLCRQRGISQRVVDAFDLQFEREDHPHDAEPGDDPRAPYRREHRFACLIEHLVAHELGLTGYREVR